MRLRTVIVAVVALALAVLLVWSLMAESVCAELTHLQKQTGLSLVTAENRSILAVIFWRRSVTKVRNLPGGIWGDILGWNASRIRFGIAASLPLHFRGRTELTTESTEMFGCQTTIVCAGDKSRLVIGSMNTGFLNASVLLFDVRSCVAQEIANVGRVTSQCWSPDNKHFVYESDANLRVYDIEQKRSNDLQVKGTQATWSPDGKRIAFLDNDTYYVADATVTKERQALFQRWHAVSGLWWSPDSRFVAYVSQAGLLDGGLVALDSELYWLRVRRLEDNSESRVAWAEGLTCYEWVTNRELLRAARFRELKGRLQALSK